MTELGYALSGEEHAPNDLVRNAQRAEAAGFSFALISVDASYDHVYFHQIARTKRASSGSTNGKSCPM